MVSVSPASERRRRLRRRFRLLLGAAGAAAIGLTAWLTQSPQSPIASSPYQPPLIKLFCRYDPELGWSKIPGHVGVRKTSEYEVEERFNSQGLRGPEYALEKAPGTYRILIVGDSFTEGYTVAFEDLFTERLREELERRTGKTVETINAGTGGYSTDQELLFFRRHGRRYAPDLTIVAFHANDVWYNSQPRYMHGAKPLYVLEGGELKLTNVPVPPPASFELPEGYRPPRHEAPLEFGIYATELDEATRDAWRITEALLGAFDRDAREAGGSLLVFNVPSRSSTDPEAEAAFRKQYKVPSGAWRLGRLAEDLTAACQRQGLELVEPTERFAAGEAPLYFAHDRHWNAAGHALAAEVLAEHLAPRIAAGR